MIPHILVKMHTVYCVIAQKANVVYDNYITTACGKKTHNQ